MDKIICGLGNPGTRYENTRHNCGFMALDELCGITNTPLPKKAKFKSLTGEAVIHGAKCLLMKPMTYMNLSGEAVVEALNFYKLNVTDLIVLFDDVSLPLGKIRVRQSGTDGGHNGIKNIIYLTGRNDFPRVKIGIDGARRERVPMIDFVTEPFQKEDGEVLETALSRAAAAAEFMAAGDVVGAMNKFNAV